MRLDNSARMNLPGQAGGNWAWRVGGPEVWERLAPEADALRALAETYGRLAPQVTLKPNPRAACLCAHRAVHAAGARPVLRLAHRA